MTKISIREKLFAFNKLIADFKELKTEKHISSVTDYDKLNQLELLTSSFTLLKETIYEKRKAATLKRVADNTSAFAFSTFELMEHNFRENTHSLNLAHLQNIYGT